MPHALKTVWTEMVRPLLRRPPGLQVAALCCRAGEEGREVLLVTSRDTGRWVLPKGWPIDGKDAPGAALQEAWEEAGVRARSVAPRPIGRFTYAKRFDGGYEVPVEAQVFEVVVDSLARHYPEAGQRERIWVSPDRAAEMVDEPELRSLLLTIQSPPDPDTADA